MAQSEEAGGVKQRSQEMFRSLMQNRMEVFQGHASRIEARGDEDKALVGRIGQRPGKDGRTCTPTRAGLESHPENTNSKLYICLKP